MFNGTVSYRSKNACRWRLSKDRLNVISCIKDKVLTINKIKQLKNYYGIDISNNVPIEKFNYWFAGFFDAEGYVNLDRKYLSIGQSDRTVLDLIVANYNCGYVYDTPQYDKRTKRYYKSWQLRFSRRDHVLKVCESIVNISHIKRPALINLHKSLK